MSSPIIDVSVFSDPVTAPDDDDLADEVLFLESLQLLSNRTRYLFDNSLDLTLQGVVGGGNGAGNRPASTGLDNVVLGYGAGAALTTAQKLILIGSGAGEEITELVTADGNICIGDLAGQFIGGAGGLVSTGNLALGARALRGASTGREQLNGNIAIGIGAMEDVGSGTFVNVAIGSGAGRSLAGGNANELIGDNAGSAITSGDNNVCLGASAGLLLETGSRNIFIGTSMQSTDIAEDDLIAIGVLTGAGGAGQLVVVDTALDSTFIGTGTPGNWGTGTGIENVAIGSSAGAALTDGGQNTLVGHDAGVILTSGDGNTFIGTQAGDLVTTGDDNICIGKTARAPSTGDGYLNIGNFLHANINSGQMRLQVAAAAAFANDASLDLAQIDGALLLNRLTTAQRDALAPLNGMLLYNSTLNKFQGYENGTWTSLI